MFNRSMFSSASTTSPSTSYTNQPQWSMLLSNIQNDILLSTNLIFKSKLTWLLIFGPIALVGKTGIFGESVCFILAGLTLIPLAERLSFVTEEVALHTNQTIGALLNATFGNAPELLISSAALQEGYYRVVQLTLLGSMLTNLLFVFGLSCFIGGLRYQVQELRIVSGNASIGMLMLAVAGLALPAALMLSDEMIMGTEEKEYVDKNGDGKSDINDGPTFSMVGFSRFNAVIMIMGYLLYLLFQLGSHSDEFDDLEEEEEEDETEMRTIGSDDEEAARPLQHHRPTHKKRKKKARKNKFCHRLFRGYTQNDEESNNNSSTINERGQYQKLNKLSPINEIELSPHSTSQSLPDYIRNKPNDQGIDIPQCRSDLGGGNIKDNDTLNASSNHRRRVSNSSLNKRNQDEESSNQEGLLLPTEQSTTNGRRPAASNKSHCSDGSDEEPYIMSVDITREIEPEEEGTSLLLYSLAVITFVIHILIIYHFHSQSTCPSEQVYYGYLLLHCLYLP